ncbi:hypothetical protein JCM19297_3472 [Nonlabens ulvanivorans]|nr:hypothetical protein JCM19297_3472 [Nonlabens ulvanivorans]
MAVKALQCCVGNRNPCVKGIAGSVGIVLQEIASAFAKPRNDEKKCKASQ